jgi:hypothetical protein
MLPRDRGRDPSARPPVRAITTARAPPRACPHLRPVPNPFRSQPEKEISGVSHIVQIQTEVRDPLAVAAACRRLGLPEPVRGTARLFEGEAAGLLVRLPGWLYPCVCDTATGAVRFDNYGGSWGDPARLDSFMQAYACEKTKIEARKRGHNVVEQSLADGSIRLTVTVGGAA